MAYADNPSRGVSWHRAAGWTSFAVLLVPFVQLGITYWVSVQVLVAGIMLFVSLRLIDGRVGITQLGIFGIVTGLAFLSLASVPNLDVEDALRVARECLVLISIMVGIPALERSGASFRSARLEPAATAAISVIALFTVIQAASLIVRQFPTFPYQWFVANFDTLPDELDLMYSDIRPSGPFGEPSYLSFATVALLIGIRGLLFARKSTWLLIVGVAVVLLSRSLAGYLSLALLSLVVAPRNYRAVMLSMAVGGIAVVVLLTLSDIDIPILSRIAEISSDKSTFFRIFAPIQVIGNFLAQYPVGVPFRSLTAALAPYASELGLPARELLHNGISNLVFSYGIVGIIMVILVVCSSRDVAIRLFLFLGMNFNGAFLAPDKLAVLLIMVALSSAAQADIVAKKGKFVNENGPNDGNSSARIRRAI